MAAALTLIPQIRSYRLGVGEEASRDTDTMEADYPGRLIEAAFIPQAQGVCVCVRVSVVTWPRSLPSINI